MKVQSPIFGAISGRLAGTVGSRTYGQNIVRSLPLNVSQPNTDEQKLARQLFAAAGFTIKQVMSFFSVVFSASKLKMPVLSYLVGFFRKNGLTGTLGNTVYDFSKLAPASDSKGIASLFTAVKNVPDQVTINWDNTDFTGIYGPSSEIHLLLIEDSESGLTKADSKKALDDDSCTFTILGTNTAKTFLLFVYIDDALLTNQSPSEMALVTV